MSKVELTGDLIKLADLFRRHADFEKPEDVKKLCDLARQFLCAVSYYYPEHGFEDANNVEVISGVSKKISELSDCAHSAGVTELILPLSMKSAFGEMVAERILNVHEFAVSMQCQTEDYDGREARMIGAVDDSVGSILKQGVRGFFDVTDAVRYEGSRIACDLV